MFGRDVGGAGLAETLVSIVKYPLLQLVVIMYPCTIRNCMSDELRHVVHVGTHKEKRNKERTRKDCWQPRPLKEDNRAFCSLALPKSTAQDRAHSLKADKRCILPTGADRLKQRLHVSTVLLSIPTSKCHLPSSLSKTNQDLLLWSQGVLRIFLSRARG